MQQGTDARAHHATGTKRKERGHTDCASLLHRQRLLGATISDDDVTALRDSRSQIFFNMKPSPSGDQSRREARDAFSHFTFVHSAGKHVVVDMHGTSGGSYSKLNILDFETQEGIADMVSRVKRGPCEGSTCGKGLVSSRMFVTA